VLIFSTQDAFDLCA